MAKGTLLSNGTFFWNLTSDWHYSCFFWNLVVVILFRFSPISTDTCTQRKKWLVNHLVMYEVTSFTPFFASFVFQIITITHLRMTFPRIFLTKWLKPPTARCKFAAVWYSGTSCCKFTTVRHLIHLCFLFVFHRPHRWPPLHGTTTTLCVLQRWTSICCKCVVVNLYK